MQFSELCYRSGTFFFPFFSWCTTASMSPVHLLFGFFIGCSQLSMDLNLVENSQANKLIMIASFFAIFGFRSEGSEHTKYGINRVDEMNNDKKKNRVNERDYCNYIELINNRVLLPSR